MLAHFYEGLILEPYDNTLFETGGIHLIRQGSF